jgi:LmbE family N-acetylglucosaminyl deacetylase
MRPRPVLLLLALFAVSAQTAAGPVTDERGLVGLQLLLRKLAVSGTVMHVTAHPDDENNALLARQSHGQGLRVILATATRGTGGQNEIGPELFEALAVLRSEELRAAHRFDGAEQMFGRAIDFGYSFSVDETFRKWGKDEILGDYVRLIRMTRPDVLVTMRPDLPGGGQHHQASALIGLEAFRAAADPSRYPDQLKEGLRPWRPAKIYKVGYYGFFRGEPPPPPGARLVAVDADVYDPLLGRTYAEIGSEARAMHKCQGFGQLLALPGSWVVKYRLADTAIPGQQRERASLAGWTPSRPRSRRRGRPAPAAPRRRSRAWSRAWRARASSRPGCPGAACPSPRGSRSASGCRARNTCSRRRS